MARRRKKSFFYVALIAGFIVGGVLAGWLIFRSPWVKKSVTVGGQTINYLEAGKGPDGIAILSKATESTWKPMLTHLTKKMHVILFVDQAVADDLLPKLISQLELTRPHLLLFEIDAPEGAHILTNSSGLFSLLVFVGPKWQPLLPQSPVSVSNPTLVLLSRDEQIRLGSNFARLNAWLKNAQFGIYRAQTPAPLGEYHRWVAGKISDFINYLTHEGKTSDSPER